MNVLVAVVLLSVGFMIGMPEVANDKGGPNSYLHVVQVAGEKPAAKAGLVTGDKIYQVGTVKNPSVQEFQNYVNEHKNEEINFVIEKEGEGRIEKKIKPALNEDTGKFGVGVGIVNVNMVKHSFFRAVYEGTVATGKYIVMIFQGFGILIRDLVTGSAPEGAVAGPVGVAVLTGEAARLGFVFLLQFTALLSLNLAVLNILPIPALDGGRLLFIIWNRIFKPIKPRMEQLIHTIGFALLMLLVVVVTVQDIGSFGGVFVNWWNKIF